MSSVKEIAPITFTTTSTVVEPQKKRGRSKKNGESSTNTKTTTTNTTTITITPKFIDMESLEPGSNITSFVSSNDNNFENHVISSSENTKNQLNKKDENHPNHDNIHNEENTNEDTGDQQNVININIEIDTIDNPDILNFNSDEDNNSGLYTVTQFNYDLLIPFILINMHASSRESILALLQTTLINCIEGRCISEGFIKPETVRIVDFKCGKIVAKNVQFNLVIECEVCNPSENSIITCIAKNITQAGIRAISSDEHLPVVVYISRDYSMLTHNNYYNTIKEGDKIRVKVIGKRFEMNDKFIQIVGDLVSPKKERLIIKNAKKIFSSSSLSSSIGEILSNAISNSSFNSSSTSSSSSSSNSTTTNSTSAPKATKTPKAPKEPKAPKAPKEPKAAKVPKQKIKSNVNTSTTIEE